MSMHGGILRLHHARDAWTHGMGRMGLCAWGTSCPDHACIPLHPHPPPLPFAPTCAGFTKEITFERSRWHGWIKDYDGGTLMECIINPKISYTNFPDLIRTQVGPEGRSSIASSSPRSATLTSQTLYVPRWDEAVPQS